MIIPNTIQAVGISFIVKRLKVKTGELRTLAGIILPQEDEDDHNGFALGVVLSVGKKVDQVKEGDFIVFRPQVTLPLPNGGMPAELYRLEETYTQVVGIVDPQEFKKAQEAAASVAKK